MEDASAVETPEMEALPELPSQNTDYLAPAPAAQQTSLFGTSSPKKTISVRRNREKPKPKKQLLVARKARPGEPLNRSLMQNGFSPGRRRGVRRTAYGGVVDRTVLGAADRFREFEAAARYRDAPDDVSRRRGGI